MSPKSPSTRGRRRSSRTTERDLLLQAASLCWGAYWFLAFAEPLMRALGAPLGRPHRDRVERFVADTSIEPLGPALTAIASLGALAVMLLWLAQTVRPRGSKSLVTPSLANVCVFVAAGFLQTAADVEGGVDAAVILVAASLATLRATVSPAPKASAGVPVPQASET